MRIFNETIVLDGSNAGEQILYVYKPISHIGFAGSLLGSDVDTEQMISIDLIDSENGNEISIARRQSILELVQLSAAGKGLYTPTLRLIEVCADGGLNLDDSKFLKITLTIVENGAAEGNSDETLVIYGLEDGNLSRNLTTYERFAIPAGVLDQRFNVEHADFVHILDAVAFNKVQLINSDSVDSFDSVEEIQLHLLKEDQLFNPASITTIPYILETSGYESMFISMNENANGVSLLAQKLKSF